MAQPVTHDLKLTRVFDAPRQLVFSAWTDPQHVAKWWGPKDFTNPVCEVDVRPGGALYIVMRGPDGTEYPTRGVFDEVVVPERLVMTATGFEDAAGAPRLEVRHTVTFDEHGGKTSLTLEALVLKSTPETAASVGGMREGWSQSLDRLADLLPAL
ncbi:MAG TPA: SRPBCC domain-containing protein [Chloroflexota bacterium]|jgi:uncharacterized protein YndB with AHSA1/START domain